MNSDISMLMFKKIILLIIFIPIIASVYFYTLVDISLLKGNYIIFDKGYKIVKERPKTWVKLKKISKRAKWAILVSEDWAFYDHAGFDPNQIKIVIKESLDEGKLVRGASTITQQVVKNVFLSNERSILRKVKEAIGAWKLEREFSKDQILEFYLNLIELGDGIYGIRAGSLFYFKKEPKDLNAREGAFLAMLLPSPKKYSVSFEKNELSDYATDTISKILIKLRQAKVLTESEREEEASQLFFWEDGKIVEEYF